MLAAQILISEFLTSNSSTLADGNGAFSDWIEIHNAGDQTENIAGWHLTDDPTRLSQWTFPEVAETTLAPGDYLVVFASGDATPDPAGNLHTDFSLSADGDYLALVRPNLDIVSEFGPSQSDYPPQRTDIAYGVDPTVVAGDPTRYFLTPTPGSANIDPIIGFVADTEFSFDRGFYSDAFSVDVSSSTVGSTLVYTTDGSAPSLTNGTQVFAGSSASPVANVPIATTTTLRAAAFKTDYLATNVDTQTYLFLDHIINQSNAPVGFPTAWGSAPAADYEMDPQVTTDPAYTTDLLAGLRELPSVSLVSETEGLFGTGGIYSNPLNNTLEIPASVEYILPDSSTGFQIDAGLKIAGGASRRPNNSPKHSMSVRFRSEYGSAKLRYDLFDGSPVDTFNSLQLRAVYNNSWIHWDQGQRGRGTLIRDQFVRDSLIAAGQDDAGRGHYTHVYINGLYWGVYNLHERADSSHYAEHQGGDAADYDALNGGAPVDGTITSWNNVKTVVASKDWTAIQQVLDVDNFIDWHLANVYGGNADLKTNGNWRAAGGGSAGGLWRMYAWDSERILEGLTAKPPNTITDATGMFADLIQVPEFVVRYGDRVQKHFTGDGAFSPAAVTERWTARAEQLRNAIVAESARWGDYRRDVHPRGATPLLYRRDQTWTPEINRVISEYFPGRTDFIVNELVSLGWLPAVASPEFRINGGVTSGGIVPAGSPLRLTSDAESIYYTVDGTDPRLVGGDVAMGALSYDPAASTVSIVDPGSVWKYEDSGTDLGTAWREVAYNDSSWTSGAAELGFGDGNEATVVSFGGDPNNKHRTTYFRNSFSHEDTGLTNLTLRLRRDDGAVVYLNGAEVARDNLPAGEISYSTRALAAAPDDGNNWLSFDVPVSLLVNGVNNVSVEIHQNSPTSSDLSFDLELIGATQTTPPIILNESTLITARARSVTGTWSAIDEALFLIPNEPASSENLRISEINYDPAADGDAEFLEFRNSSSGANAVVVDLDGVTITDGPSVPYVFPPNTQLAPGESAVVVRDVTAFAAAYPDVDPSRIVGQYVGKLSNSGERIRVFDASDVEIADLTYETGSPWPKWADGIGGSLVLVDPANTPAAEVGKPYRYRGSVEFGGSPAAAEQQPLGIVINEVLAHTDDPLTDSIELFNSTAVAIDVSGWFLSDSGSTPKKYRIADGTVIPAGGYLVYDESDFNPPQPNSTSLQPFALSGSRGDSVWLFSGDGTDATGFADHVTFDATFNGFSVGRLEGSQGRLVPLANRSLGTVNGMFLASALFVSEVNYHPSDPTPEALLLDATISASDLEFIELVNDSAGSIDLLNWRLRGEGDFDFDLATPLAAGDTLVVVSFDPDDPTNADLASAFRTHYGIGTDVELVGPFSGTLSNSYGIVKLQAPDQPPADEPNLIPAVTVDQVFYDDLAPWPVAADGTGKSLQRVASSTLGTYADSWRGESPTPGNVPERASVESITINAGDDTRSVVTSLEVQFDRAVEVAPSAFVLTDRDSGQAVGNLQLTTELLGGKTVTTIRFGDDPLVVTRTGADNSLVDGNFELRVVASEIRLQGADTEMANDYLFGSDDADKLFRLFGDVDGDRDVDGQDYGRFGLSFLKSTGDPAYNLSFDFDGDGDVDGQDYGRFGLNFLTSL